MKKYTYIFLKNRLLIVFSAAALLFLLFFFVLLINKNAVYALPFALWVYVPAAVWYSIDILLSIRFQRMIRYQEQYFNVVFSDADSVPLFPGSITYLSDDWLIFSGKTAFYRKYVGKITVERVHTNMGNDYYLKIQTCDGRTYTKAIDSYTNARKIQDWFLDP